MFFTIDLMGAVLTLVVLLLLGLSGYLWARLLLREQAVADPLALAIASLLAMTAEAQLLGLALGKLGLLRIELAVVLLGIFTLVLLRWTRSPGADRWAPVRLVGQRVGARLREHPAMALIAFHALASEGVRGLIRPPLSWDSLMYHLPIVATWLRDGRIGPVFGMAPMNFYGYQPAGGAVWLWWWMAPSHSELYVNLACFPQAALLALAVGGVARELGARRSWPCAAYLILLTPTVIRFTATQYVDIYVGAGIAAATFFGLRWMREPRWGDALLAGAGLGMAASAKVLGLAYALALAPVALVLSSWLRGAWGRRAAQAAAALVLLALLGGVFYLQNIAAGVGPFAARCDQGPGMSSVKVAPRIPRANTVAALWPEMVEKGRILDTFLGVTHPQSLELGVGPQVFLLLPALLLPLGLRREWRGGALVASQIAVQAFLWVTVPYASSGHVFANVRYLIGALGLACAGVVAWAERRGASDAWLGGITLAFLIQDLLMLHTEMPRGVRLTLAVLDTLAVALALWPGLRAFARRRWKLLAAATVVLLVAGAPYLGAFRVDDRGRAFLDEFTAHRTATRHFARAWHWLDLYGGNGNVAVVSQPINYFIYPAMGTHLERRVVYVNINRQNSKNAADYPRCDPRVDPDPQAWLENLATEDVRWVHLSRFPQLDFAQEAEWMQARPDLFLLRYEDPANLLYELLPWRARHL